MSESDGDRHGDLIAVLRRVRRRLRLRRALDAMVLGGTVALAVAAALALLRVGQPGDGARAAAWAAVPLMGRLGLLLAAAVIGGLLGAMVTLARTAAGELAAAAAAVDRWLGRQAGAGEAHGDRARVALALGDLPSAFARAAVADAAERAGTVPVREAAPLHRPRRLGALAIAAACGVLAAVAPGMAPTAATGRGSPGAIGKRATGSLAAAMTEVRAIGESARARGDDELAALADQLHRWLARSAEGATTAPAELADIAARARRSAEEGAQAAAVLARVAAALEKTDAARALGQAFARLDAEAIATEARAAGAGPGTSAALAEALARAAAAAATKDAENAGPRRLDGLEPGAAAGGPRPRAGAAPGAGSPAGSPERQLRRLERDLRETADACASDPARCGPELGARANDLAEPARQAAGADAREQLARTAERMAGGNEAGPGESGQPRAGGARPSAVGRGAMSAGGGREISRDSAGAATAGSASAGPASAGGASTGGALSQADEAAATAAQQAFERAARGEPGAGSAAAGEGAGQGAGSGEASGAGAAGQPAPAVAAGPRVELSIPEGEGPTRAEAIRTGADRGFARPGYAPVFRDYQAAMEDGLEQTEIPAERRQLVRRYFQLIRPR